MFVEKGLEGLRRLRRVGGRLDAVCFDPDRFVWWVVVFCGVGADLRCFGPYVAFVVYAVSFRL